MTGKEISLSAACEQINKELDLSAQQQVSPFLIYYWWKKGYIQKPSGAEGKGEKKWLTEPYVKHLTKMCLLHIRFGVKLDSLYTIAPYFKFKKFERDEQYRRITNTSVDFKATSGGGLHALADVADGGDS